VTKYVLASNLTAGQTLPGLPVRPLPASAMGNVQLQASGNQLDSNIPVPAPGPQTFQVFLTGTGVCSATWQFYGSNTGSAADMVPYGPPLTVATSGSGAQKATAGLSMSQSWGFFAAQLVSISGTSATSSADMNC
jgi:hypothetical protein